MNEKFGGFNKVVFEGKKEEKLDIGRELKWEYTTTFQPKMFQPECQADLSISYTQMYDKVRVDTTIRQDGCPASSGEYRIRMRTRAEDGAVNNHEFHESWSREEPGTLEFRKDYPMGEDPDLIWARIQTSHNSNCRCAPVAMEESVPGGIGHPTLRQHALSPRHKAAPWNAVRRALAPSLAEFIDAFNTGLVADGLVPCRICRCVQDGRPQGVAPTRPVPSPPVPFNAIPRPHAARPESPKSDHR